MNFSESMFRILIIACFVPALCHDHEIHDPNIRHHHAFLDGLLTKPSSMDEVAIVDESEILKEEILSSVKGMKKIFDSDEAGLSVELESRSKRQVDEQDIRRALCKD